MILTKERKEALRQETHYLEMEIRNRYAQLDRKFHLNASKIEISFGFDTDVLGAYVMENAREEEHFHFSLLFIGRSLEKPLSTEDRLDLYLHEYAHYMQYHMEIPAEYLWQPGVHGSAWKYCCSLVGAAPTPYYKAGESLMKHDYDKILEKPKLNSKIMVAQSQTKAQKEYKAWKNSKVEYKIGEVIVHPKYQEGEIIDIDATSGTIRLRVRFRDSEKLIAQEWLLKNTRYKKAQGN